MGNLQRVEREDNSVWKLVEYAGTRHTLPSMMDSVDAANDVLLALGIDSPRSRYVSGLPGFEVEGIFVSDEAEAETGRMVEKMLNQVRGLVHTRTGESAQKMFESFLLETEAYLLDRAESMDQKKIISEALESMKPVTPWAELPVYSDQDPNQTKVDVVEGGALQALAIVEVARKCDRISDLAAGRFTGQILEVATMEDSVLAFLFNPEAIHRMEIEVPGIRTRRGKSSQRRLKLNKELNAAIVGVSELYGRHFKDIRILDLTAVSEHLTTQGELAELYYWHSVMGMASFFPELSGSVRRLMKFKFNVNRTRET